MKTIEIENPEELKKYFDGKQYHIPGNLIFISSNDIYINDGFLLEVDGNLISYNRNWIIVDGFVKVKKNINISGSIEAKHIVSGGYINVDTMIMSKYYIGACRSINCGCSVCNSGFMVARGSIRAKEYIDVPKGSIMTEGLIEVGSFIVCDNIRAEDYVKAGDYVYSYAYDIRAKCLITNKLPYRRHFWAEMSPLKKWKDKILDINLCWDDYRKMISKKEAKKICDWEGWHWILRAHLEMFFGLRKAVMPPKEYGKI